MKIIQSGCVLYFLLIVSSCTPEGSPPDSTPPSVIKLFPDSGAVNVSLNVRPAVIFDEPVNPGTVDAAAFTVITRVGEYTGPVSGIVECFGDTLVFTPDSKLLPNLRYNPNINISIEDMAGNKIDTLFSWTFITAPSDDKVAPLIINVSPASGATGVSPDSKIIIAFNEKIRDKTVSSKSFSLRLSSTTVGGTIQGKISCIDSIAVFEPLYKLQARSSYEVRVSTDIMDIAGNNLYSGLTWRFSTGDNP